MGLYNIFMGVPQSKYAGLSIIVAILVVAISILFGKQSMPLSQKIGAVLLLIAVSLPGILYCLFQLTCLVTGAGVNNQRWWCALYGWLISALLIIYSVLLITVAILSIFSGVNISKQTDKYYVENFKEKFAVATNMAGSATQTAGAYGANGAYGNYPSNVATATNAGGSNNGLSTGTVATSSKLNNGLSTGTVATSSKLNNGLSTGTVATSSKLNNGNGATANNAANVYSATQAQAQTFNVDVGTVRSGKLEQDRKNDPFLSAENPANYPFPNTPYGHGWEPMNGPDLPPGA